jgi:sulfite exporter TauE/SafE/copper chaperone CopZ
MSNKKIIVPIKGMHCKSCEILIEQELKELKGVNHVNADYRRSEADIYYHDAEPSAEHIAEAIGQAGYSVGTSEDNKNFLSRNKSDYKDLGLAALFLVGIYFLLKGLGITNLSVGAASSDLTAPLILMVGLTAGFSTCMALVGGLILGISAKHSEAHPEATASEKFRPHLFFQAGRIIAFAVLGGLLGLLGSVFQLSSTWLGVLTVAVGLVMLVMGLQLIEIFPWAKNFKFALPKTLGRVLGISNHQKEYSHKNSLVLGALTFFLPCGFTQAMQVYAVSTGSFWGGVTVMTLFALGTMPGLLGIGGLTSVVKGVLARRFFKLAGLAVIIFAVFNMANGFGLAGFDLSLGQTAKGSVEVNDPNVTLVNGVQVVKMKETARGYEPNSFTVKKGVPVKWVITAEAPYTCAASIILSKYGIRKNLVQGENIIEFTPTEAGKLRFSCSMGMYTGVFNVVDGNGKTGPSANDVDETAPVAGCSINGAGSGSSGGCGGGASGGGCGCGGGSGGGCGGGNKQFTPNPGTTETSAVAPVEAPVVQTAPTAPVKTQVIKTSFTVANDIQPNTFTVKAGVPVQFIVDPKEDGVGCMAAITIPGLYDQVILLEAGKRITMNFTPTKSGKYMIACAMNIPRGYIVVE